MRATGSRAPKPWHTAVAGALGGYLVMVRDTTQASLKRQINMAIGIRTLYAVAAYLVRTGSVPGFTAPEAGYMRGRNAWYVALWAVVMWHWRHPSAHMATHKTAETHAATWWRVLGSIVAYLTQRKG